MDALQFSEPDFAALRDLDPLDWEKLLAVCDSSQVTLLLNHLCGSYLPENIQARISENVRDNTARFEKLKTSLHEIAGRLEERAIDFCLLKGLAHSPHFSPNPLLRSQGDIDLWCQEDQLTAAYEVLVELGYRPFGKSKGRHLDPMIRETDWEWRGNYFAPDLPIPVDLHFNLWDQKMELTPGPCEEQIWNRRTYLFLEGREISTLGKADSLTFAALHLMMHLLHGDLRLQRAWEIGHFLESHTSDADFWSYWHGLYSTEVRRLQLIVFALANQWFACSLPPLVAEEIAALPDDLSLWLTRYGLSPVEGLFTPNKDELWLNLSLLSSYRDKARVFFRRLLPVHAAFVSSSAPSPARRQFTRSRIVHHLCVLPSLSRGALEWWWLSQHFTREFSTFLFASVLFDFGEFIFFLLYNLYLLDIGFNERFIGQVTAAVTAGTFAGVIPAAALTRRLGLRNAVMIAILGTTSATALRALVTWEPGMLVCAFLNGLFMSFWAVSLPPAVAAFTSLPNRTLGFSLITSLGIGIGALAAFIGSRIPSAVMYLDPSLSAPASKRIALLIGSACAALAAIPTVLMRFPAVLPTQPAHRRYPKSRFVYSFLATIFIWTIGTGVFNSFFSVYFTRSMRMNLASIGLIFSCGQLLQVISIPFAPLILRRVGEVRGITGMQLATGVALGLLALVASPSLATILYLAYMSLQYMSEPCLLSMLMSRVNDAEQSGASALNFLISSLAGILAVSAAGVMLPKVGYGPTLSVCAGAIAVASGLFYFFLRDQVKR